VARGGKDSKLTIKAIKIQNLLIITILKNSNRVRSPYLQGKGFKIIIAGGVSGSGDLFVP
jgi:hypothetical protein